MANAATTDRTASRASSRQRTNTETASNVTQQADTGKPADAAPKSETKRQPKPREESANTTQTQEAAAVAAVVDKLAETPIMILCAKNPKRAGSIAAKHFDFYTGASNVREAITNGVRGKDLSWDADRGHILVGEDVTAYQALKTDDERREWLTAKFGNSTKVGLTYVLKQAGLYVEPKKEEPAPTEAEGDKQPEATGDESKSDSTETESKEPAAAES